MLAILELMYYNMTVDAPVFVEYTIMQYDLTFNHLLSGVILMVHYPLLRLDRDHQLARSQVIDLLKKGEPVCLRQGMQQVALQLVENDGIEYIRPNAQSVPWDL